VAELLREDADAVINISVSFDGTWQKRGFTSHYGIGVCIDIFTGLVIDYRRFYPPIAMRVPLKKLPGRKERSQMRKFTAGEKLMTVHKIFGAQARQWSRRQRRGCGPGL